MFFISSCSAITGTSPKQAVQLKPQSIQPQKTDAAEAIIYGLKNRNSALKTFKGTGTIKLYNKGIRQTTRLAWAGSLPDKIRIEILSLAGRPDLSIAGNGRKLYFLFHQNRKIYKKAFNADLNKLISIPVKTTEIITLLSGRIPILKYKTALFKKTPAPNTSVIILKNAEEEILEKIFLAANEKDVRRIEIFNPKGSLRYAAAFNGIRKINAYSVPTGFELSDKDAVVHISIDKYWTDIIIDQSVFTLGNE